MIQIQIVDQSGKMVGLVNRFAADNTDCATEAKRKALWAKAEIAAEQWSRIFPDKKFVVVEISQKQNSAQMKWWKSRVLA